VISAERCLVSAGLFFAYIVYSVENNSVKHIRGKNLRLSIIGKQRVILITEEKSYPC
jgi:hypothetical protein